MVAKDRTLNHLRQRLAASFNNAKVSLTEISKVNGKRRVTDVEREWHSEHQGLMARMKAALAECAE